MSAAAWFYIAYRGHSSTENDAAENRFFNPPRSRVGVSRESISELVTGKWRAVGPIYLQRGGEGVGVVGGAPISERRGPNPPPPNRKYKYRKCTRSFSDPGRDRWGGALYLRGSSVKGAIWEIDYFPTWQSIYACMASAICGYSARRGNFPRRNYCRGVAIFSF